MMSEVTLYTMAQVAENNGKNGKRVWVVIKDLVYDVTDYMEEHPGGSDLIKDEAGKDATKAFNDFGHSTDAKNILKKFKIGELVEEDKKQNRAKTGKEPKVKTISINENRKSCLSIITCGCLA